MTKKTVIITGGNAGLGYQCAKYIAMNKEEYKVILACRNEEKAISAQNKLRNETGNVDIHALELDLASASSIRRFHDAFQDGNYGPLYALVGNAGIHPSGFAYTQDGFEETFGVNHLGHYLLANLMLSEMSNKGRIVFVASDMHDPAKIMPFSTPVFKDARALAYPDEKDKTQSQLRYPTSKLCNILCAYEMSSRITSETNMNVTVNAFNPGFMPDTSLSGALGPIARIFIPRLASVFAALLGKGSNAEKSGKILASLITDPRYEKANGTYNDRGKSVKSSEPSYNKIAARDLWTQSAELVGLKQSETPLSIS
ncbi:SDR family NAD(P)-dependent oxidoreductase [Saccharibacillus endophyticus]|uniref:Dehydrogenase/reductase n=1 Tax=Saccharibacillus endophyticus TaxID=2060666 RepID=A0ABQ1ZYT2_9BACL|nr:SDR family NAD(P)-dependent oxidoreductase [Saccharibacillus endophyticus]GGH80785.1 dehydrogenase/reductase [Saccharibacillus endophyticus]